MRFSMVIVLALLALAAATVQAGTIHPALQERMDKMSADEPISVIVHMTEQANISQLDAALHDTRATREVRHREVVHALQQAAQSQEALLNDLSGRKRIGGVIGYKSYWISNLLVVYAAKAEIERIAARLDVDVVEMNFEPELITPIQTGGDSETETEASVTRGIGVTPGLRAINAPQVWYELGFTGEGRLIGSCDTGVDGNHPALADRWRGNFHPWQECWLDVVGTASDFPSDYNDHGTHTTGTMCGLAPDDTVGVAWEAQWIACNPIDQGVSSDFDNDIITVYEWFADPDGDPYTVDDVPDVIQNSWRIHEGFSGDYVDCDSRWWAVIDNCEASGVVTVWSAGNEGPSQHTIGSPADRATTPTNCFSIGAVDATNYSWPYPIASFSSRGPSGCLEPPENVIKPEVVGPGVDVYSSVPGGGFQGGWSGTSMSGPHVAGVVALMRQANPDLEVEEIKLIIMETSIDEGAAGEDNIYGWGFIDAYEAVIRGMQGFGQVAGHVYNGSYNNTPIPGALVEILDTSYRYTTDEDGSYLGYAAPGTYMAQASAPGFASREVPVEVIGDQVTTTDFYLADIAGPAISEVSEPVMTTDTTGPYPITARVIDYSSVAEVKLIYRVNGGSWQEAVMTLNGEVYTADLPGSPAHSRLEYYVWAQDGIGLTSVLPAGAPTEFFTLLISELLYGYAMEDPEDPYWQLGVPGDQADAGLWERGDPIGVYYPSGDAWTTPEDDHTPDPGYKCFITGNSTTDYSADDVDHGCTTLVSPVFDLSGVDVAFVRYWRYYYEGGNAIDDEFAVDVSDDGGATWVPLERVPDVQNSWQEVAFDLSDFIQLTDQVLFRFLACDLNDGGLVEVCIDDFAVEFALEPVVNDVPGGDAPDRPAFSLTQNHPNPFNPATQISFSLPEAQTVRLSIYTVDGRKVATLLSADLPAGAHSVIWDGKNDRDQKMASGTYFYNIEAGPYSLTKRMMLVK